MITELTPKPTRFEGIFPRLEEVPNEAFPTHLAIIMDGNRRWRRSVGMQRDLDGHFEGFKTAVKLTRNSRVLPINIFTLWAFSADNWRRDVGEIEGLMGLMNQAVQEHLPELQERNARFIHLGRKDRIPQNLAATLAAAESATANNSGQAICLAIDFGGQDQERRIAEEVALKVANLVRANPNVDNETILRLAQPNQTERLRDGNGLIPPADLIIRPSESRTSDIGWLNGKSTVLHFVEDKYFPEMSEADIEDGVLRYVQTQHRHGT